MKYWNNFNVWHNLLLFSVIADLMSTMIAVANFGVEIEANPIVRYVLANNLFYFPIIYGIMLTIIIKSLKTLWNSKPLKFNRNGIKIVILLYATGWFNNVIMLWSWS